MHKKIKFFTIFHFFILTQVYAANSPPQVTELNIKQSPEALRTETDFTPAITLEWKEVQDRNPGGLITDYQIHLFEGIEACKNGTPLLAKKRSITPSYLHNPNLGSSPTLQAGKIYAAKVQAMNNLRIYGAFSSCVSIKIEVPPFFSSIKVNPLGDETFKITPECKNTSTLPKDNEYLLECSNCNSTGVHGKFGQWTSADLLGNIFFTISKGIPGKSDTILVKCRQRNYSATTQKIVTVNWPNQVVSGEHFPHGNYLGQSTQKGICGDDINQEFLKSTLINGKNFSACCAFEDSAVDSKKECNRQTEMNPNKYLQIRIEPESNMPFKSVNQSGLCRIQEKLLTEETKKNILREFRGFQPKAAIQLIAQLSTNPIVPNKLNYQHSFTERRTPSERDDYFGPWYKIPCYRDVIRVDVTRNRKTICSINLNEACK